MITFQEVVLRLTEFWMEQGCTVHQGHDVETGAGTFNPATFLRCLGPEPYNTVYVEPSRRPQDGRYGQNPNRVYLFHQLQVIMKPSPPNIQELYLKSLESLGLNLKEHDIRFVHDDWEAPTQGASGMGWEVWVDGMEATQFTYFQTVGGVPLKPITAELAYGLERLCMYLQNVDSIYDIQWSDQLKFGDVIKQNEEQWSAYNFEHASTDMWKKHFEDYEKEASHLIEQELPLPAYDFVIKASHAFNMLDARGVISPTERTGYIARVRDLSCRIADSYLSQRQRLAFPLKQGQELDPAPTLPEEKPEKNPEKKDLFLLEVGSEELPSFYVDQGLFALKTAIEKLLVEHKLSTGPIHAYGTPRRLTIMIEDLVRGTQDTQAERKGPAVSAAFSSDGNSTLPGQGFLKSVGVSDATLRNIKEGKFPNLEIREIKGQDYLFAMITTPGCATSSILAKALPKILSSLHFPKKMRWANYETEYPRPIRWLVCMHGKKTVPFSFGHQIAGHTTYGHAQLKPGPIALKDAEDYMETLKKHSVLVDQNERKQAIADQLSALEKEISGTAIRKERLLPEVIQLSEWPQLAVGHFDEKFLRAPDEVLISEMALHQRYFPLISSGGKLMNHFILTADNTPSAIIVQGNQKVLSARLSDGLFLYDQDRKSSLEAMNKRLEKIVFQKSLGTVADKVKRLEKHSRLLADLLQTTPPEKAEKAAHLCKADLASLLVGEFPELQGTIGKDYALCQKEDPEIADAIEEHWMPRHEGAPLPKSPLGRILSLSDKIDNLLGYFSVGLKPTSSSDPYACRRTAIGLIKILLDAEYSFDLSLVLNQAAAHFPSMPSETPHEVLDYITIRAKGVFEEKGFKKDEIEASLQGLCIDPFDQYLRTRALHSFRKTEHFNHLYEVYKRAKGQHDARIESPIDSSLFSEEPEKALYNHIEKITPDYNNALNDSEYTQIFDLLALLRPHLSELFNKVKILDENEAVRTNRLALIQAVFDLFEPLVDFSKIQV